MYENFFEITKDSRHYQEWFDYLKADEQQRVQIRKFGKKHNVTIQVYSIWNDSLWVKPELNEHLQDQFAKAQTQGVARFKFTSPIGKAFKQAEIKRAEKPFVPWFFKGCYGKSKTREFDYDGKVYCQIESESKITETPIGFIRIKASEFYKVLEALQEQEKE